LFRKKDVGFFILGQKSWVTMKHTPYMNFVWLLLLICQKKSCKMSENVLRKAAALFWGEFPAKNV
jgi:hypothetical protein